MAKPRREYDALGQILWVHWSSLRGQALIARDQLQPFIDILLDGRIDDGPIQAIRFVFEDRAAAEYNHDSLKFVRVETWLAEGKDRKPLKPASSPSFSTREDFGMPKG